jgi:general secretion pathway protein A
MKDLATWFGLKRQPFEKDIKPKDLFAADALRECTARLDHIKRTGGIMLLTGDPGVGKTVALRRFCDSLNDNLYRTLYTPLATLSCIDILRHINQLLGLPLRNAKSVLFAQIQRELLESMEQRGKTIVLVIDEAQLLKIGPLQELRLLTNFKMDSVEPFILILAGQSDLDRIMDYAILEPFAQRLRLRYHMAPLTPTETSAYVEHHLKLCGATEPIFAKDALTTLHEVSYAIPRRIGSIAVQAMFHAMFSDKRTVDANAVLTVKAAA